MLRRSDTVVALMVLCVSLALGGCDSYLGHRFRLEPDEAMMKISASDFGWLVTTTLEAEKFDCRIRAEPNRITRRSGFWCINLHDKLSMHYRPESNAVELTLRPEEDVPLLPGRAERYFRRFDRHAEMLDASFEAAGLVVVCSKPRFESCSID